MTTKPENPSAIRLSTGRDEPVCAVPLGLEGFPTSISVKVGDERKKVPVAYFEKDAIECGDYVHPITGQKFSVTEKTIDGWVDKFNAMRTAGVEIHAPLDHSESAADNQGFIVKMRRDGKRLKVTPQVFGEDGAMLALRNRCSIFVDPNYKDETGRNWGDAIGHVGFTPVPVIGGQGPFIPLAASRGEPADTQTLFLSASKQTEEIPMLDLTTLRTAIGADTKLPDADVITQAVAKLTEGKTALELSRTQKDELDTARARASSAEAKALELSRAANPVDNGLLVKIAKTYERQIDQVLREGKCTKAQADTLKAAMKDGDKIDGLMLSRSETDNSPIDVALKVLELNKSITGTVTGLQRVEDPNDPTPKPITKERKREVLALAGINSKDDE